MKARHTIQWNHLLKAFIVIALIASFIPAPARVKAESGSLPYKLLVDTTGFYRVTYEDLLAQGLDLNGVRASEIALTSQGQSVPIYVQSGTFFSPGDYFEFYGEALDSLYTHTNVYYLMVNAGLAQRIAVDNTRVPRNADAATYYMESALLDENKAYANTAPISDPWYDTRMLTYTSPNAWSYTVTIQDALPGAAPASLFVSMYGGTDWNDSPDHHVVLSFNGTQVADDTFDGLANHPVNVANVPFQEGINTLNITLPGDTGVSWDIVYFNSLELTYPRAFVAINGSLNFTASDDMFTVSNLPTNDVVVYRLDAGSPTRMSNVDIAGSAGNFSASFAGSGVMSEYYVYSTDALLAPQIIPQRAMTDITSGSADYILITHPDFINNLSALTQLRQGQGLTVKVVDVFDIYEQFGNGIVTPQAIKAYVSHAALNMGTEYIVLVGGDTYDYFNYLGSGSQSFIPTYYVSTDDIVKFSPADPWYADYTGDNVPDVAIGRLPVSTPAQLDDLVNKIMAFETKNYAGTAVFAADRFYGNYTDTFVDTLPPNWLVYKAYLDQMSAAEARDLLLEKMNNGIALASYFGHSTTTEWTSSGLFNTNDAETLLNTDRPMVVTQYGCWNSYFVEPAQNTLVHKLLLSGNRGAAAVMGSTTLAYNHSLREFGQKLTPKLTTDGKTIGQAFLEAKQELAQTRLGYVEIYLGFNLFGDPAMELNSGAFHTPVTLAWFTSQTTQNGVRFEWTTATEVANVGFNLYAKTESGWEQINPQLIPSNVLDSIEPQDYSYEASNVTGDTFYIEDVAANNQTRLHGPYLLGETYGEKPVVDPIDWDAIRSEHEIKSTARQKELVNQAAPVSAPSTNLPEAPYQMYLPITIQPSTGSQDFPQIQLLVDEDGLYRMTYEELLAAGFDLEGAKASDLALLNRGQAVPMRVVASLNFGPGGYIEFYGQAVDSLYTHTNVYVLQVDPSNALRISEDNLRPAYGSQAAAYYMETTTVANNVFYSFGSPNGDPWYAKRMLAYTSPKSWDFNLTVDNYVPGVTAATFEIDLWGVTDFEISPDHHVIAEINGTQVADTFFDGQVVSTLSGVLPTGTLVEGDNTIRLTLPGDTGADWDVVNLESYAITYPRGFMARQGILTFNAAGQKFSVDGLPSSEVVVYRLDDSTPVRLTQVEVQATQNGYQASFAGKSEAHTYLVYAREAIATPAVQPVPEAQEINTGNAQYLIISHPDFINDLDTLVSARQAQGFEVKVVNVDDIYAHYSDFIFDPLAIKAYIAYAAQNMGTQYVLLVGGDTYDYLDYLGSGSISFIPTLYAATDSIVRFAPVDPLFADVDGDLIPDVALGRFPVRTSSELALMINKTLAYANKDYAQTSIFTADAFDGATSFKQTSENIAQQMPQTWSKIFAYIDDLGVEAARNLLLNTINNGVALVSFVGHSGTNRWTYQGLFNTDDAAGLGNDGRPTVVTQWACWNTYYVSPTYNTLGYKFLLSGNQGAAAVMGASTLTMNETEAMLGEKLMPKLVQPGMTIGSAILSAKQELGAESFPLDILLGWTLLGDPALVIQP